MIIDEGRERGTATADPKIQGPFLIELAKEFPNFGYVKEEAGPVV